ncbi:Serine/threonine-protein kinase smu1, partial [Nowakowskiella sp. JEL0078]
MAEVNIPVEDVVLLIHQFLKEHNLLNTLQELQKETKLTARSLEKDKKDELLNWIKDGHWDNVLNTIITLNIPSAKLISLFELIVKDLLILNEQQAARSFLLNSDPLILLRSLSPSRFRKLEELFNLQHLKEEDVLYPKDYSKERQRLMVADEIAAEITTVAPSRLLTLLGQSLKWQYAQGLITPEASFDLFLGTTIRNSNEHDLPVVQCASTIKFPKKSHPESIAFSPDAQFLATGSVDGLIEVWNHHTGRLRKDLKYQAEDRFMMMQTAVLALDVSRDSHSLASGDQAGRIQIWDVTTGICARRFTNAHSQGVTCVKFAKDGASVVSGGFDMRVKVHGVKSGRLLKEFVGHTGFVNDVVWVLDVIVSAGADGAVKVWNSKSTECLHTMVLNDGIVSGRGLKGVAGTAPT